MSAAMCHNRQHLMQAVEHGVIGKAHDLHAGELQVCLPSLVVGTKPVVHGAVHFDDEA